MNAAYRPTVEIMLKILDDEYWKLCGHSNPSFGAACWFRHRRAAVVGVCGKTSRNPNAAHETVYNTFEGNGADRVVSVIWLQDMDICFQGEPEP